MRWVTRSHVHVDRVACPWLIRRFVDSRAGILLVARERLARIGHAADIASDLKTDEIAPGLEAIATGFSLLKPDDAANLGAQFPVYDALHAWCRLQVARGQKA